MTASPSPETVLPPSQVAELIQNLVKALRAFQMYLPNNPIYQRAIQNVRAAFTPIWAATDELTLVVAETDFVWEEQAVYQQVNKSESIAWALFKDGLRVLTFQRGAEEEEVPRLLEVINRARFLSADAGDDLLTLLWEQEFQRIQYRFVDVFADGTPLEASGPASAVTPAERQAQVQEEAPRPKGVVDLDDFDSTLYFLDEAEVTYIAKGVEDEYQRDLREAALNAVFDIFETQTDSAVRAEVLGVLENLFPNLLSTGAFRITAMVLREARVLATRAPALSADDRRRLDQLVARLSDGPIVRQLVQSLDESAHRPSDADVALLLGELRPAALESLVAALPDVATDAVRTLVAASAERLAAGHPAEVLRVLRLPESPALREMIALAGRLEIQQAVAPLGELLGHADAEVRLAAVQALSRIGTAGALTHIDRAIGDDDRAVRLAAVRAAGARGYKNALKRVEAVVLGKAIKEMDLTEKMAFFEAYGAIAGPSALNALGGMLLPRGLLKLKEPPETRACAAMALGKIGTPEARDLLQRAADDKELVVRNAVSRALRGTPA